MAKAISKLKKIMFTSQISKKAWAIYREICPKKEQELSQSKEDKAREKANYLSQAVKAAYAYFKALKKGVVKFFKIKDIKTMEVELVERRVVSVEEYGYKASSDRQIKASQFTFIDLEKIGIERPFISFNTWQLA